MACSDNVVRAGFTSKFKDVDTLINMLTYETQRIDILLGTNEVTDIILINDKL